MPDQNVSKDSQNKPGYKLFSVSVNLTIRRYLLLREAGELLKNNDDIDFAFAEFNYSLLFRFPCIRHFNSENELHNLINI